MESVPAAAVRTDQPGVCAAHAELTGWSTEIAPGSASTPDTGNMEVLHLFRNGGARASGSSPAGGTIAAAFSMTEPAVASSDARNIETSIVRDGDDYIINGRKWWTSGANDPRCAVLSGDGPNESGGRTASAAVHDPVPVETPGLTIVRSIIGVRLVVQHGHAEIVYDKICFRRRHGFWRSPRRDWAPGESTTACGRSVSPGVRWH